MAATRVAWILAGQVWDLPGKAHKVSVGFTRGIVGFTRKAGTYIVIIFNHLTKIIPWDLAGDSNIKNQISLRIACPGKPHSDKVDKFYQELAMGTVHDLIEERGKQEALRFDFDRQVVEAAAAYMANEDTGIGFLYSGWCQAALPHRKLPNDQGWQLDVEYVRLIVEPGMRGTSSGRPELVGIPYGSRARLILLRLQSEALRTNSRDVELGKSLRDWLERMGIPVGGRSLKDVRDQTERISRCRLTFEVRQGNRIGIQPHNIMESAVFLEAEDPSQPSLFTQHARLSTAFYEGLRKHSVPLEESAIRAIANNSMALDIYAWLAYRLHALVKPTPAPWRSLKQQFGAGFNRLDNFKATFTSNLRLAMAVYRDARVEEDRDMLVLYPSKPPVSPRQIAVRSC